eukprot:488421-Lingulodinium_polyedra.AAC.1
MPGLAEDVSRAIAAWGWELISKRFQPFLGEATAPWCLGCHGPWAGFRYRGWPAGPPGRSWADGGGGGGGPVVQSAP